MSSPDRVGFGMADRVATLLQEIATEAKAGTVHEAHDGWSWPYPKRDLICGCGAVLVANEVAP